MAITTNSNNASTSNKEKKEAEGYLNLKIKDAKGNYHNIPAYIPLTSEKAIHRALLNNCEEGAKEFEIVGYVNLAQKQDEEIEL